MSELQLLLITQGTILAVFALVLFGLLWLIGKTISGILQGFEQVVEFSMQALSGAMRTVSEAIQPPPTLAPKIPVPAAPPTAPVATPALPPAAKNEAFPNAPSWFNWAVHEIGTKEGPDNTGAAIARYISLAHAGAQGDPWCAIFANAALESCSVTGSRSPSSQSFRTNPNFVQLSGPALGCLVVFWRGSKTSGLGHVGFYRGELGNEIWVLGGNEDDMVQIAAFPKDSASFGLVGYWWPKSVPLPKGGPVMMPAGSPTHITIAPTAQPAEGADTSAVFSDITATVFGSGTDTEHSAYDGHKINTTELGVALPFHFSGPRRKVRVVNAQTGASALGDIVDVGPWYPNQRKGQPADPYWTTNSRPRAEGDGTTNHAGIDLTPGLAAAIGIDGKGKVHWNFVA